MSKSVRVYAVARELKLDVIEVIQKLKELGISVNNKYSELTGDQEKRVKEEFSRIKRKKRRETLKDGGAMVRKRVVASVRKKAAPKIKAETEKTKPDVDPTPKVTAEKAKKVVVAKPVSVEKESKVVKTDSTTKTVAEKTKPVKKATGKAPKEKIAEPAKVEKPAEKPKVAKKEQKVIKAAAVKKESKKAVKKESVKKSAKEQAVAKTKKNETEIKDTPSIDSPFSKVAELHKAGKLGVEKKPQAKKPSKKKKDNAKKKSAPMKLAGKRIHRSPLPNRPEASASPAADEEKKSSGPVASRTSGKVEYNSKQLGPTGRFIVLPKPATPKNTTNKTENNDNNQSQTGKGKRGSDRYSDYRNRKNEDELLRKTGPTKKKVKHERPAIPPEGKRKIKIDEFISVSELAKSMSIKSIELIKKLLSLGQIVNINSTLDIDTASIVASEWGYEITNITFKEDEVLGDDEPEDDSQMESRPPIVTIMGHVDHGKTSLLDVIRKSDIVSNESGGITQHIGAYKVKTNEGEIVFIDTPGHEAFSAMRARGASVTDLVILVIAADDGVMPQTVEAINHCKEAKVPFVIAVTKIDKSNANTQMVREKLTIHEIVDEKWGGDTIIVDVSSTNKTGIDTLLEMVLLQAEMLDLKSNPNAPAKAVVLEAELHKAKGPIANILILSGKLEVGNFIISGTTGGKVRTMIDDRDRKIKLAGPATPVEVTGLDGVPAPGDDFRVVKDEKTSKQILVRRREDAKKKELARKSQAKGMDAIRLAIAKGQQEQLNIILKTDVHGTMEAIKDALLRLSTEKVKVNVVHAGVGGINETDINLATTANAVVMGFRVRPAAKARHKAEKEGIAINQYNVIYDMVDDVQDLMKGLLPKEKKEKLMGKIEVRQVFTIPKIGSIAGSYVLEGKVNRSCHLRLYRDDVQIHEGKVSSLRRFKEDAKEVMQGYECGIGFENYHDIKEGDILEVYEIVEVQAEL